MSVAMQDMPFSERIKYMDDDELLSRFANQWAAVEHYRRIAEYDRANGETEDYQLMREELLNRLLRGGSRKLHSQEVQDD